MPQPATAPARRYANVLRNMRANKRVLPARPQRDNYMTVSWECQEQLARQEAENDDDIRLSYRLFRACLPDKKKFCADVKPGNSQARALCESWLELPFCVSYAVGC